MVTALGHRLCTNHDVRGERTKPLDPNL